MDNKISMLSALKNVIRVKTMAMIFYGTRCRKKQIIKTEFNLEFNFIDLAIISKPTDFTFLFLI
jgi:hypothetical protein